MLIYLCLGKKEVKLNNDMNIEGDLKLEGIHADSNATVRGGNVDCNKKIIK